MTARINNAVKELIDAVRSESDSTVVSFELFINHCESVIETNVKDPAGLRRQGISMRNIKGEWIT